MAKQQRKRGVTEQSGLSELWSRLRFLVLALLVYRLGSHVPVPGIDPVQLEQLFNQNQGTILGLFNLFSGGALQRMSVFALGVIPYISSSIIMQLLTAVTPSLDQLRKEGEAGRRKITQYTRYGAVALAFIQSSGLAVALANQGITYTTGMGFHIPAVLTFTAGTAFLIFLGEQINERGIGNGISMLIFAGIVATLPSAIGQSLELARLGEINLITLLAVFVGGIMLIGAIVYVERAQRRIPISYPNSQMMGGMSRSSASHLPLKLNVAGVIPPIFASSILLFPASLGQWFGESDSSGWLQTIALSLAPGELLYAILFAIGVIFFCFFYTSVVFNPRDVANNLKRSNAFIPGIRPGDQTTKYIEDVMTKLTMFGAVYITLVALLPQQFLVNTGIFLNFGGTSILIMVVVALDLLSQVQSHLMSHQYGSLMKKANLTSYGH